MNNNIDKQIIEKRKLRNFGITMAIVLTIVGSLLLWNDRQACLYFFAIASIFLISGLVFPKWLKPIEYVWMKLAFVMGAISTRIILIIVYYLAVVPIGLLRQLFSKDPLEIKINKKAKSYWKPVDSKDSKSRYYKPY